MDENKGLLKQIELQDNHLASLLNKSLLVSPISCKLLQTKFSPKFIHENHLDKLIGIEEAYKVSECNETEAVIYIFIKKNGYKSTGYLGSYLNLSRTIVHNYLKTLEAKRLLVMVKKGKNLIVKTVHG